MNHNLAISALVGLSLLIDRAPVAKFVSNAALLARTPTLAGAIRQARINCPFVALSWMVAQARSAGVRMGVPDVGSSIPTTNPLIHDQSNALRVGRPTDAQGNARQFTVRGLLGSSTHTVEDRTVQGAVSGSRQRDMGFTNFGPNNRSMTSADTMSFITYLPRDLESQRNNAQAWETRGPQQVNGGTNQTGRVDIAGYTRWLRQNGYCFAGDACDRRARQ